MATSRCIVVQPGEGRSYWLAGDRVRFLVDSEQTGGKFALGEVEVVPGGGPPPHLHRLDDECFYVIDGDMQFIHDKATFKGRAGFAAMLSKNITHTFKNAGQKAARMLVLVFPSGFEDFAREAGTPCAGTHAPPELDIPRLSSACTKYGIELRPDWKAEPASAPQPDNRELWVFGNHVKLKLTSANTDGRVSVMEGCVMPGAGVPPHAHNREDEMFYMVEGTCRFVLHGKPIDVSAGGFVYVPQGAMHGFSNPGNGTVRFVNYHTPGGFENFFLEAGVPYTDASKSPTAPVDIPRVMQLMKKHGMTFPS